MRKREERRKLELRRERLRMLAQLTGDQMVRVAGGGWEGWGDAANYLHGRSARSQTC